MKTLWRMNAAGHIPSAVRCSMGPLLAAHGRASNRSSWSVQAGLDHPCVQHACSMVAAITASQGVPVSLGGRSISARRWTSSSVWNRLARPFTIRRSSVAAGHPSRTPSISSSKGLFPVVIALARTVVPAVSRVNSPPALALIASLFHLWIAVIALQLGPFDRGRPPVLVLRGACGATCYLTMLEGDFKGSSPRVRGVADGTLPVSGVRRFIPACAARSVWD